MMTWEGVETQGHERERKKWAELSLLPAKTLQVAVRP
jgi:hypothetical protein